MTVSVAVQLAAGAGCTTVYVPGWALVAAFLAATAPRLARRVLGDRFPGGSGRDDASR